jgi:hypothetical protein
MFRHLSWSWSEFTTDSQSVSQSWCQTPIWNPRPISISPWNFLWTVVVLLFCSAHSDERTGLKFTVQFLLGLARTVTFTLKSRRTHGHILLSHLRLLQPGGPGPRIYISQEQGGSVIPPGTAFPFVVSSDSQGYGGGIITRLHTGTPDC